MVACKETALEKPRVVHLEAEKHRNRDREMQTETERHGRPGLNI